MQGTPFNNFNQGYPFQNISNQPQFNMQPPNEQETNSFCEQDQQYQQQMQNQVNQQNEAYTQFANPFQQSTQFQQPTSQYQFQQLQQQQQQPAFSFGQQQPQFQMNHSTNLFNVPNQQLNNEDTEDDHYDEDYVEEYHHDLNEEQKEAAINTSTDEEKELLEYCVPESNALQELQQEVNENFNLEDYLKFRAELEHDEQFQNMIQQQQQLHSVLDHNDMMM